MGDYNFLDRFFHRIALQSASIAEFSFDLDQSLVKSDPKLILNERHVFVSGLARAGTTILMRRLYSTEAFHSLTYREMPFILAPNLMRKLGKISKRNVEASDRAHGDRIMVDVDSPESFDEVFWRVFCGEEYIKDTHLVPHSPDSEKMWDYVRFVNAVLNSRGNRVTRYISKNNNNILRLKSIRYTFPKALVLIPFRDPSTHAYSLFRMHQAFSEIQTNDSFVKSYMTWLVHHEFGLTHRPFQYKQDEVDSAIPLDSGTYNYWLNLWLASYEWIDKTAPSDAIFVCYEDLCTDPRVWENIEHVCGVRSPTNELETLDLSIQKVSEIADQALMQKATSLYNRLAEKARAFH